MQRHSKPQATVVVMASALALSACATNNDQRELLHQRADGTHVPTAMQKDTSAHPRVDMPAAADHEPPIIPPGSLADPKAQH